MCTWLEDGNGEVAVYDATNTTMERRELINEFVVEKYGFKVRRVRIDKCTKLMLFC